MQKTIKFQKKLAKNAQMSYKITSVRQKSSRRGGRAVECTSLENWRGGNSTEGSNPSLSAIK